MDSLLANYASSDEEAEYQKPPNPKPSSNSPFNSLPPPKQNPTSTTTTTTTTRSSLFSSLPKPKPNPSSLFQSLPKPKQETQQPPDLISKPSQSSSPFLSLPPPKSQIPNKPTSNSSSNPKRVVQFKPPIIPITSTQLDDDDDEEEEEQERLRRRKAAAEASSAQPLSVTSFLSAIPAPRNSLNLGVSSSGSGRRAVVESESAIVEETNVIAAAAAGYESNVDPSVVNYESSYGGYDSYQAGVGVDQNVGVVSGSDPSSYDGYATGYSGYAASYGNDWVDGSAAAVMGGVPAEAGFKGSGKRRRNDVPTEIVEVKQDELMKNRPREDQSKATGIAFGPSYQPVSTKGKPTKLHKRKHQIGSLYFDMKQKETELQERRSRGFLTKAETQAKYGW